MASTITNKLAGRYAAGSTLSALLLGLALAGSAAAADVGVSVSISQPGVYGRVDIGRFPQPQLVVQQPVIIRAPVAHQGVQPVYLWVPPGHRRNWRAHCAHYGACGVPVYFVRDDWYHQHVDGPGRRDEGRDERGGGREHDRGHGREHGERGGERGGEGRGHGG